MLSIIHPITASLLCLIAISTSANAADSTPPTTSTTRYVWANGLFLRTQADSKSAQLAKIPYGATLTLSNDADATVPHSEVFLKSTSEGKTSTALLDGAWRKVHWQDKDGWVFDGYLSRYPAPDDAALEAESSKSKDGASIDVLYYRHVFGPNPNAASGAMEWNNGDSRKSASYKEMCKYLKSIGVKCEPPAEGSWGWQQQPLAQGATFIGYASGDGPGESAFSYRNMSLTFNEAILWAMHFNHISKDKNVNNNGGLDGFDFTPGKLLEIYETRASGCPQVDTIRCNDKSCDIEQYGQAD